MRLCHGMGEPTDDSSDYLCDLEPIFNEGETLLQPRRFWVNPLSNASSFQASEYSSSQHSVSGSSQGIL